MILPPLVFPGTGHWSYLHELTEGGERPVRDEGHVTGGGDDGRRDERRGGKIGGTVLEYFLVKMASLFASATVHRRHNIQHNDARNNDT